MDKQKIIYFWSMKAYDKCRNKIDSALLRRRRLCLTAGGHDSPLVFRVAARIDDSPVVSARALGTVRRNRSATWTSVVEELLRRMLVIFRSFNVDYPNGIWDKEKITSPASVTAMARSVPSHQISLKAGSAPNCWWHTSRGALSWHVHLKNIHKCDQGH